MRNGDRERGRIGGREGRKEKGREGGREGDGKEEGIHLGYGKDDFYGGDVFMIRS